MWGWGWGWNGYGLNPPRCWGAGAGRGAGGRAQVGARSCPPPQVGPGAASGPRHGRPGARLRPWRPRRPRPRAGAPPPPLPGCRCVAAGLPAWPHGGPTQWRLCGRRWRASSRTGAARSCAAPGLLLRGPPPPWARTPCAPPAEQHHSALTQASSPSAYRDYESHASLRFAIRATGSALLGSEQKYNLPKQLLLLCLTTQ